MITWLTAFIDTPDLERSARFWTAITETSLSRRRGSLDEFATLLPRVGGAHLRIQQIDGPSRVHLDLHVADPAAAAVVAVDLGAQIVADFGYLVMRSPGGLEFCFVSAPPGEPVSATSFGSLADQVSIDIDHDAYESEVDFWSAMTGWSVAKLGLPEFQRLDVPPDLPLKVLLQRRESTGSLVAAHLDFACLDRAAEVARHVGEGACVVLENQWWTTLRDPLGLAYCLTDRTLG